MQRISVSASRGFLRKHAAPHVWAAFSSPGSWRAVIMMTGTGIWDAVRCSLSSIPLIPGIWMSVTMQAKLSTAPLARNSTADAKPRASYPADRTNATMALRTESSSSMMAIRFPAGTRRPFRRLAATTRRGARGTSVAHAETRENHTQVLALCIQVIFGFSASAMRTRSASVRAPILRIAAPR